jgi:HK97 family phage prohead protease
MKNPIMLLNHNHDVVLGKWNHVAVDGDKLVGEPEFDMDDAEAAKWANKVNKGYVNSASIAIQILDLEIAEQEGMLCLVVNKSELKEVSLVSVPANANAVKLFDKSGVEVTEESIELMLSDYKSNKKQNNMSKLKLLALALSLADTATEDEVISAVNNLKKDKSDLEGKVKELSDKVQKMNEDNEAKQKLAIKQLLDDAQKQGKFSADKRSVYEELCSKDFESTKIVIDGLQPYKPLSAQMGDKSAAAAREDWDFGKWQKEDPAGLQLMSEKDPEGFKSLKEAYIIKLRDKK